jgi:hypothetical protein
VDLDAASVAMIDRAILDLLTQWYGVEPLATSALAKLALARTPISMDEDPCCLRRCLRAAILLRAGAIKGGVAPQHYLTEEWKVWGLPYGSTRLERDDPPAHRTSRRSS